MKNFPTLKTTVPELVLQPLDKKHLPFIVTLLNDTEVQKTLYRVPTKVTLEKESKALDRMYGDEKPKEITYILTIKSFLSEKYIGYVKIKLIDWTVWSCYISVAILPDTAFRGKGYSKASYLAFFDYLFSLGMMKIYGRTYENNLPTIKLNESTGFRFIGRQTDFILYPNKTTLDALFFEKLNPKLELDYTKRYAKDLDELSSILKKISEDRDKGKFTNETKASSIEALSALSRDNYLPSVSKYLDKVIEELSSESADSVSYTPSAMSTLVRSFRAQNAIAAGYSILAYPVTKSQLVEEQALASYITELLGVTNRSNANYSNLDNALWYAAYTPENWEFLHTLFLGKVPSLSLSNSSHNN